MCFCEGDVCRSPPYDTHCNILCNDKRKRLNLEKNRVLSAKIFYTNIDYIHISLYR